MSDRDRVAAGQAVYTPLTLRAYDWFVLGLSNHLLWRCSTSKLLALYERNVSGVHLDVGVGTGYFLDRARWPVTDPDITLVDLNANSLRFAAGRIARFLPSTVVANALAPLPVEQRFRSAGLCYLLHCLPGPMSEKAPAVFDNVAAALVDGATLFGATIVQGDAPRSRPAQWLMNFYNDKGVFSNRDDTIEDLRGALEQRFSDVRVHSYGAVATFEATRRPVA